jgi:hypothetical protein
MRRAWLVARRTQYVGPEAFKLPNEHIAAYLNDYLSRPSPVGFAVLIAGPWGSGKTFFIKDYFSGVDTVRHLYVSLHGVSTEEELRTRFVFAAYPLLKSKKFKAIGSLARSAVGVLGFETDLTASDLLEYDQFDVLVIDDLERALVPLETVFGFLSQLVEQEGRKVILVGSEDVLRSEPSKFKDIKEKTVGFTLSIEPDVESVLAAIQSKAPAELAETIRVFWSQIVQIFLISETRNLRVLGQILDEYAPIAKTLETDKRLSKSYKEDALKLFLVISMAYKTGKIDRKDIATREGNHFTRLFAQDGDKADDSPMGQLDSHFRDVDVYSMALDNDYLETRICDGLHRDDFLARTVGDAAAQSDPDSNPEWRNVWYYMQGNDDLTRASFPALRKKFEAREYTDGGVILHVFGLLLEARVLGLLNWSERRILREGKRYIDDLIKSENLPTLGDDFLAGFRHGAAHGLGFTAPRNPVFQELKAYFQRRSDELKRIRLVERVRRAAAHLADEPRIFSSMISSSEIDGEVYSNPVLQILSVRDFAARFMACDGPSQHEIMLGLATRYTSNPYPEVLELERPWLKQLRQAIGGKLRGRDRLTKVRIGRLMEWSLSDPIQTSTSDNEEPPEEA